MPGVLQMSILVVGLLVLLLDFVVSYTSLLNEYRSLLNKGCSQKSSFKCHVEFMDPTRRTIDICCDLLWVYKTKKK